MAVVATFVDEGWSSTDGTSFSTNSESVTADDLVLIAVTSNGSVAAPTLSGLGATWVEVATSVSSTPRRITLFRAQIPSSTTGAVTISFAATTTICAFWFIRVTGQELGNNGADAIETVDTNNGAGVSLALDLTGSSTGATIGFACHNTTNGITVTAPAVEFAASASHSSPNGRTGAGWDDEGGSTIEFSSSASRTWALVGVRVIEASAEPPAEPDPPTVKLRESGTFTAYPIKVRVSGTFA